MNPEITGPIRRKRSGLVERTMVYFWNRSAAPKTGPKNGDAVYTAIGAPTESERNTSATEPDATLRNAAPEHPTKNLPIKNVTILLLNATIKLKMIKKLNEARY